MRDAKSKPAGVKPEPPSERDKFPARLHVLVARDAKIGLSSERMLHDFNDMKFEALAAPY